MAKYHKHQAAGAQEKHTVTSVLNCFFCATRKTERTTFFRMRLQKQEYIVGASISAPVCEKHRKALVGGGVLCEGTRYLGHV